MNLFPLLVTLLLLITLYSCGPKNQEVTNEQIETGNPTKVLDSIATAREDGVNTDGNRPVSSLSLSQPVIALLDAKYPNWKQPELATAAKMRAENYQTGPTIVNGNFNSDTTQDYALQLQQGDKVIIVAILQDTTQTWKTHELHRDILFNENGNLRSLYNLHLVEKGDEVQDLETLKEVKTTNNALAVSKGNGSQVYIYEKGKFRTYRIGR